MNKSVCHLVWVLARSQSEGGATFYLHYMCACLATGWHRRQLARAHFSDSTRGVWHFRELQLLCNTVAHRRHQGVGDASYCPVPSVAWAILPGLNSSAGSLSLTGLGPSSGTLHDYSETEGPCEETAKGTGIFSRSWSKAIVTWGCKTAKGEITPK